MERPRKHDAMLWALSLFQEEQRYGRWGAGLRGRDVLGPRGRGRDARATFGGGGGGGHVVRARALLSVKMASPSAALPLSISDNDDAQHRSSHHQRHYR